MIVVEGMLTTITVNWYAGKLFCCIRGKTEECESQDGICENISRNRGDNNVVDYSIFDLEQRGMHRLECVTNAFDAGWFKMLIRLNKCLNKQNSKRNVINKLQDRCLPQPIPKGRFGSA
ncbi:hypothetical protein CEXT_307801 [Caerostris extrusa]|uniref:Uncharacterized protein n=1 Tax=Caerostris extrusa TaxID=172846 RepID=A0AAV4NKC9_CAEEX|nr:hypothetical protein CEXT_307801 [Caerostris extrusa]